MQKGLARVHPEVEDRRMEPGVPQVSVCVVDAPTVVWNSFDAGDAYASSGGWAATGGYGTGCAFVPSASGHLDAITAPLFAPSGAAIQPITLTIYEDAGGAFGPVVWKTDAQTSSSYLGALFTLSSVGGPLLVEGKSYFLMLTSAAPVSSNVAWQSAPTGPSTTTVNCQPGSACTFYPHDPGRALRVGVK